MKRFLIVQTAFIGDVILATSIIEKIHIHYPDAKIDFILRKGNEGLFINHPFINQVFIWDKKNGKFKNLINLILELRKTKYSYLINLQRFASSGLITFFSKAECKIGFDKNPFSFFFNKKIIHQIGNGRHEIERNQQTIKNITDDIALKPKLYPSNEHVLRVISIHEKYQVKENFYYCLAPASIWFTKQFPEHKWVELIKLLDSENGIFLLGGHTDFDLCQRIIDKSKVACINLSGKIGFLESAELMKNAKMNFVNDSAPLHLCSAVNAPVTAIYCSTIPEFGFGPLSDNSTIIQINETLACRPCGLHGYKSCPKSDFKCGNNISIKDFLKFNN